MSHGLMASPDLLAAVAAAVPARIVKRLDADRAVARAWTWGVGAEGGTVTTGNGEVVTVRAVAAVVASVGDLSCSCLLSPRCFHVLAVAASLDIQEGVAAAVESETATDANATNAALTNLDRSARAAAVRARELSADVLAVGAHGVGALLEGELLRVVHLARVAGMHRLASAALRVVRDARDLRSEADDFTLATLVEDLRDLAGTAVRLDRDAVDPDAIGVARRAYESVGHLRLVGVASEPVVARGGYGGVVTHLLDEHGGLWSIGDVLPGGEGRARGAYDAALAMGDTTITHRALSRGGLFVQDATASPDRRLGAGKQVKAVRATTDLGWTAPAVRARFDEPLEAQVARAYESLALPEERRPRGATLLFLRASVAGYDELALTLASEAGPLRLLAPTSHGTLGTFENLRQLAGAEGLALEVVASLVPDAPRTLALVAFSAEGLALPEAWRGVVNAGYDVLQRAAVRGPRSHAPAVEAAADGVFDPLVAFRRRIERIALHGARSLPPEATGAVDAERASLQRLMMGGAADLLGTLAATAQARRPALRDAWLASATYARTATAALWRAAWLG